MILVFPPELAASRLEEVVAGVQELGWNAQVSHAPEQTVVSLEGAGDPARLEALLAGSEVDVIPIRTTRQYRLQRSRRLLLTVLATALGLITVAGAGVPLVGFLLPPKGQLNDPDRVFAGSVSRLRAGTARTVLFRGRPVLVIRPEEDLFVALEATCTHLERCGLEWDGQRRILECPCHGDSFDIYGNVLRGPASIPLPSYAVERLGDRLFLRRNG